MPHDLRKTRKLRGSRTAGWGQVAQHRRSSRKGGRGMAGRRTHKFALFLAQGGPTRGFIRKPIRKPVEAVNLTQLERLAASSAIEAGKSTVDLSSVGVDKLLGGGVAPKNVEIVVSSWSKRAEEKVKAAGGSIRKP
jgi:large subunit ribosomal protein L15